MLKLIFIVEEDLKFAENEVDYTNLMAEKIVLQQIRKSIFDENGIIVTH